MYINNSYYQVQYRTRDMKTTQINPRQDTTRQEKIRKQSKRRHDKTSYVKNLRFLVLVLFAKTPPRRRQCGNTA
jgi:hypothetical protein